MKRLLIISALLLTACGKVPESSVTKGEFNVERLFTVDGCTAYRFNDAGRYIYYTNCAGTTQTTTPRQCGKTPCPETDNVQTYRR